MSPKALCGIGESCKHLANKTLSVAMIGSRGFYVRQSGLETHVRELARILASRGHRVTVYGRCTDQFARIPQSLLGHTGVETKDGACSSGKFIATMVNTVWATFDALRSKRFDILHYHGVGCVFAILMAKMSRLPVVLTLHSTNWEEEKWSRLSGWLIHRLERIAVRIADAVISVSQAIGARTRGEYGVESYVTAPGSGVFLQDDVSCDDEVMESLGLEKRGYVLFVGRIIPDKGCHVLVEALKRVGLPCKLVLAGPAQDKKYYDSLVAQAGDSAIMVGVQSDRELGSLYRCCLVFCMASTTEGLPIALIDALAHGAPCIVSDIPGHRQLVTNPKMRFPAGDIQALSSRLSEMCARFGATDEVSSRAEAGARWLQSHPEYGFEAVADQVLGAYEGVRWPKSHRAPRRFGIGG